MIFKVLLISEEEPEHEHKYVEGKCECGAEDPDYVKPSTGEYTLAEALELADGTAVIVKGTVVVVEGWNEKYGNMNFTIKDATGELYVYACAYKVVKGDIVTITGVMGSYNGAKQIAKGATCEVTGHDSSYDPAADAVIINFDNIFWNFGRFTQSQIRKIAYVVWVRFPTPYILSLRRERRVEDNAPYRFIRGEAGHLRYHDRYIVSISSLFFLSLSG